jgi:hypothetical protein
MTDDELTAAARTLHREWDSPALWTAIAAEIRASEHRTAASRPRHRSPFAWAAAALVVFATAATLMLMRDRLSPGIVQDTDSAARLLSEEALTELEHAEARYLAAIEALATKAAPAVSMSATPLAANLRERLLVIDAAIADCRAEIERNRFNAHLRRQLLSIYQEKRRTLEQILELEQHVS